MVIQMAPRLCRCCARKLTRVQGPVSPPCGSTRHNLLGVPRNKSSHKEHIDHKARAENTPGEIGPLSFFVPFVFFVAIPILDHAPLQIEHRHEHSGAHAAKVVMVFLVRDTQRDSLIQPLRPGDLPIVLVAAKGSWIPFFFEEPIVVRF